MDFMNTKLISQIIDKHVTTEEESGSTKERKLITLSVPYEVWEDFEKLQRVSKKKFVKALKELVIKTIEVGKDKFNSNAQV